MKVISRKWNVWVSWMLVLVLCLSAIAPGTSVRVQAEEARGAVFEASEIGIQEGVPQTAVDTQKALESLRNLQEGTVTVRYRAAKSGLMSLFSVANSRVANNHTHVYVNGSAIGYEVRDGSGNVNTGSASAPNACDGQWHTVTFVFSSSGTRAYYDGDKVLENSQTGFISSCPNLDTVSLGKTARPSGSNEYLFSGTIHGIQVFSEVLTEEEIMASHAATVREEKEVELPDSACRTEDQAVFYQGYQGSVSYRIPSLLTTRKGTVLAAIDKRQSGSGDQGNIDTLLRRSLDNGKTWLDGQVIFNLPAGQSQHALTIDPVMVEDEETGRIFMLVDMFPESQAAMNTSLLEKGSGYKEVDGKRYCILRDYESRLDSTHNYTKTYTIREYGEVWLEGDAPEDAVPTEYTVPDFHTGELFKHDEPAGNIFIYTGSGAGELKVVRNMRIWSSYSDDDGRTWSDPVDLTHFYKEDWMLFAGTGPGVGIQLKQGEHKGRLVIPIYVANGNWTAAQASAVIFSDDHGETWQMCETSPLEAGGVRLEDGSFSSQIITESQLVEMNDGTLILFCRNSSGAVKYSVSADGGNTWSAPIRDGAVTDVYCQLTVVHYPDLVDGKEAVILANPDGPGGRKNGAVRIGLYDSAQQSFEWKYQQPINEGDYAYSCLTVLDNGEIGLLYEDQIPSILFTRFSLDWITAERTALDTKPVIQSVDLEKEEGALVFRIEFDSHMLTLGTPVLDFTMDGTEREAVLVSGNVTKELTFRYTGDTDYERLTVTNVRAFGENEIGNAAMDLPDPGEFTFQGDGEAVCTCRIQELGVEPESIVIPSENETASRALKGVMKASGCSREDHSFTPVYTFSLEDSGQTGAVLENDRLTVSSEGMVTIKVSAELNGVTADAVCKITVEKAAAGEDVNQAPEAMDPVPKQVVDSLEGKSFTGDEIAVDPEGMPLVITEILSDPGTGYLAELKDGIVTVYGKKQGSATLLVSVSDGQKSAVVNVPVQITGEGAYEREDFDYLSDLNCMTASEVGYGSLQVDKNVAGGTITLRDESQNTVSFAKGYGAHCNSSLTFQLPEGHAYREFKTSFGVDAGQPARASITFRIFVDGNEVFTSEPLQSTSIMGNAAVDITGASELILTATHGGSDGNGHSVWAGSRLIGEKSEDIYEDSLIQKIGEAKEYQADVYTEESFGRLTEAIAEAEELIDRSFGEQQEYFEQMKALEKAVKGLMVRVPAEKITLNHQELILEEGKNRKLYADLVTSDGRESTDRIAWTSENPQVASVSDTGRVQARSGGTTTITASVRGELTASCTVTVLSEVLVEISFAPGEGGTGEAPEAISAAPGSEILLPENTFMREGYEFAGWSNGSSIYEAGGSYQVPAVDKVLTAVWEKKEVPSERIENLTGRADSSYGSQPASYAVDNDTATHWHSNWEPIDVEIDPNDPENCVNNGYTIDLGQVYEVTKLEYLPRQGEGDGVQNGRIARFRLLYSENGEDYQLITLNGTDTWANNAELKSAKFDPVSARYIRIEALETTGNTDNKFINAAEFYVYKVKEEKEECTCTLSEVTFTGGEAILRAGEKEVQFPLNASARILGDCPVYGHQQEKITYTYTIVKGSEIAEIEGNVMTVRAAGEIEVKTEAMANGKTASGNARFLVTGEQLKTVKLSFSGGEGALGTAPAVITAEPGTRVALPASTFVREGWDFLGWSDGTSIFGAGASYQTGETDVVFQAVWQKRQNQTGPGQTGPQQTAAPGKPSHIRAVSNKTNKIKISWNQVSGAEGYLVYRYDSAKKSWKQVGDTAGTSFTDSKRKPGTVYMYQVQAYRKDQSQIKKGELSKILKTASAPGKPKIGVKAQGKGKVKISWKKVKGCSGYEIFMKKGKAKFKKILQKKAKAGFAVKSKLKKGQRYQFKIRSYKRAGKTKIYSAYSKTVKVKIQ